MLFGRMRRGVRAAAAALLLASCSATVVSDLPTTSAEHEVALAPKAVEENTNMQTPAPSPSPQPAPKPRANLPSGPIAPAVKSDTWINTPPLEWDALRGKVVMVEFWTFD